MKSQPECGYDSDDAKCHKCISDHKGCFWGGISQMGQTEKRLRTSRKTADVVVDLTGDDGKVAGSSRLGMEVVMSSRPKRQVKRDVSPTGECVQNSIALS